MTDSEALRGAVAQPVITTGGLRTELRLIEVSALGARYEVRWFLGRSGTDTALPTAEQATAPSAHGTATLSQGGEVTVTLEAGELPDWARAFTDKLLRTTARGVQDGRYPRRLTRWRDAPD